MLATFAVYHFERCRGTVVGQRLAGLHYQQVDTGRHRFDAHRIRVICFGVACVHERTEAACHVALIKGQIFHLCLQKLLLFWIELIDNLKSFDEDSMDSLLNKNLTKKCLPVNVDSLFSPDS